MIKKFKAMLILLLLLPALLLQGCWIPTRPAAPVFIEPELPEFVQPDIVPDAPQLPGQFTIRYVTDATMNPIIALNRDNIIIGSLLYESLFILDANLTAKSLLCANWETEDNVTFTFEIYSDIVMHDGSFLTADDVAYSLRQARDLRRSRHRGKLRNVTSISSDGELTVTLTLENPNARFIRLLDIPIIKAGTVDERVPPGSGPFIFPFEGARRLTRFTEYRHFNDLPINSFNLIESNDSEITRLFDDGELSLLWDDPAGAFDIRLNRALEPRFYNTTALQFIGFNADSFVLRSSDVRRAIGCAIERQFIVDNIMNDPRPNQAIAAPVAISPVFDMYDHQWEVRGDLLSEMGALIERAGLADFDNDSFLEMPDGYGGFRKFTLDFIVNLENTHKIAAAHRIADNLRQFGFDINVRELQWGEFMSALRDGKFDMYYGETLLSADFDFSPLLLPGDDSIIFGNTGSSSFNPLILNFLAASSQEEVSLAGEQLNLAITQQAPFIPILYKRYAIYTQMGAVVMSQDTSPSQSGIFHNFQNWTIDLFMLN